MIDYVWLFRLLPLGAYLLLLGAGIALVRQRSMLGRCIVAAFALGLAAVLINSNGLISGAGWVLEGALFFVLCALVGLGLGYGRILIRQGRVRHAAGALTGAATATAWWAISAGGVVGMASPYNGWGSAALPPLAGGVALAYALSSKHLQRRRYVALWLLFAGTIGIGAYMNRMEGITYAFVAPERMFGPYAEVRVAEAVLASVTATLLYVAGSLLLLLLPLRPSGKEIGGRKDDRGGHGVAAGRHTHSFAGALR